jgi:L-glyceraldehyde 3-phosphate reductase
MAAFKEIYRPADDRYNGSMPYRRVGNSGLRLSALSLGFWWNFGEFDTLDSCKQRIHYAFDKGITTFDLANNYGPPYGAAEETFGKVYAQSLRPYRDEIIVTSKAGHDMWQGPYGDGSSRKMLLTSINRSLERMGLDYVDIFYSHRYDGFTPVEETMQALVDIVHSGKAIYVGLSKYPPEQLAIALEYLAQAHVPCLIYQDKSNMLVDNLTPERRALLQKYGVGYTAFSPLQQGILTDKYINGIPQESRAANGKHLHTSDITPELVSKLRKLNDFARDARGQSLAQMAISWLLRDAATSSVILGPRTIEQLSSLLPAVEKTEFSQEEIQAINAILA